LEYKLLTEFSKLFAGNKYNHRVSTHGDRVAIYLYEDLITLARSQKYVAAFSSGSRVLNAQNVTVGKKSRRGDGTFGERVPHIAPIQVPGLAVAFGKVATIEIGTEVKILAKAMRKQLDRVCTDLEKQVAEFKRLGGNPVCVGIVGVNWSESYTSYEGSRRYATDGKERKHPSQEAPSAERDLIDRVKSKFDELVVLRFRATNVRPFEFSWVNQEETENLYGAALVRISREYEARF
jgi:hypothetical protein